jgi:hypothetical protein
MDKSVLMFRLRIESQNVRHAQSRMLQTMFDPAGRSSLERKDLDMIAGTSVTTLPFVKSGSITITSGMRYRPRCECTRSRVSVYDRMRRVLRQLKKNAPTSVCNQPCAFFPAVLSTSTLSTNSTSGS